MDRRPPAPERERAAAWSLRLCREDPAAWEDRSPIAGFAEPRMPLRRAASYKRGRRRLLMKTVDELP
jgi:hypothetical protein